jgi:hypothetical protein
VHSKAAFALYMKSKVMTDLFEVMAHRESVRGQVNAQALP